MWLGAEVKEYWALVFQVFLSVENCPTQGSLVSFLIGSITSTAATTSLGTFTLLQLFKFHRFHQIRSFYLSTSSVFCFPRKKILPRKGLCGHHSATKSCDLLNDNVVLKKYTVYIYDIFFNVLVIVAIDIFQAKMPKPLKLMFCDGKLWSLACWSNKTRHSKTALRTLDIVRDIFF